MFNYIKKSHAEIDNILDDNVRISAAIFNLGYLPGGDKSIITKSTSTLTALTACLKKITDRWTGCDGDLLRPSRWQKRGKICC